MGIEGQKKTKESYLDPKIVAGYLEKHGKHPKLFAQVEQFASTLPGKRIIDVGCGTGHDTHHFVELGYQAVGVDYSPEMIKAARTLGQPDNQPTFEVLDMREIGTRFEENSFDGAWVSASMLHIPEEDVPTILKGLKKIVANGGKIYIGLKAGKQGAEIVGEDKYGQPMEREFIFWEEQNFRNVVEKSGLTVERVDRGEGGKTGGENTSWLNFWLEVRK